MTLIEIRVEVRAAWWLELYLYGLITVAMLMDCEPDPAKVMRTILRAMRWRFAGARRWHRLI